MTEPLTSETLRELVLRAQQGDSAAWASLYLVHESALYTYVYHRVGRDRSRADDVFHDTVVKAVERVAQFDPERGEFAAWLTGIARNELRKLARSAKRSPSQPLSDQLADEIEPPSDVGAGVNRAFTTLRHTHQQVLSMKYQHGESLESIATTMGSTPAAVGSLLHRARAAFRVAYTRMAGGACD